MTSERSDERRCATCKWWESGNGYTWGNCAHPRPSEWLIFSSCGCDVEIDGSAREIDGTDCPTYQPKEEK